ncbi:MAG: GmrSD restriction endonuclease domain-containing protein [Bacteroidia bacterium]
MKKQEKVNVAIIKAETEENYSNDDIFNITSWGADMSFRELITMYEEDELLKPELQRKYVWDKAEASRFIESILLGLPVPSIFLAKTKEDNRLIIDGFQRIMTIYDYVKGIFSQDNKIFKLSNAEKINERWRGKAFGELNDTEQKRIKNTTIHAIIFEQKVHSEKDTSLYQIFERINTSGRTLKPQEIRNCVYQGKFNTLLFELNKLQTWRGLFGLKTEEPRMLDLEFITRYFALSTDEIKKSKLNRIALKKELNEFMGAKESQDEKVIERRKNDFTVTMNTIQNVIGNDAFHNISKKDDDKLNPKFHPAVFDSIAIATSYAIAKGVKIASITDLKKRRLTLLKNVDYKKYVSIRTTDISSINGRIGLACKVLFNIDYE